MSGLDAQLIGGLVVGVFAEAIEPVAIAIVTRSDDRCSGRVGGRSEWARGENSYGHGGEQQQSCDE